MNSLPEGASVPSLGLSNKAVFQGEAQNLYGNGELQPQTNSQYAESYFSPISLTGASYFLLSILFIIRILLVGLFDSFHLIPFINRVNKI